MLNRSNQSFRFLVVWGVLFVAAFTVLAATKPSNKWRIKFDGKANNDSKIVFRIIPTKGDPQEVEVAIPKGKTENGVASLVRDALKAGLGEGYHVERDDFEDVLIKVRGRTPNFGLELASSSVTGLKIKLHRE